MIALALLLAVSAQDVPQIEADASARAQEILVLGERMRSWSGRVESSRRGASGCVTVRSTGDRELDAVACDSMVHCISRFEARIREISDHRRGARRRAFREQVDRELTACVAERHDLLLAELAERRFQARREASDAQD